MGTGPGAPRRIRARWRLLLLLAAATAAPGCIRDPDPIALDDRAISVHAVLQAGADSAVVLLTRWTDEAATDPFGGVSGAIVGLGTGPDTTWLTEDLESGCKRLDPFQPEPGVGPGCYTGTLPEPVRTGATYHLEIRLPDGRRVSGETTVPEPVALRSPGQDARFVVDCGDEASCSGPAVDGPPYTLPVAAIPAAWERAGEVRSTAVVVTPVAVYLDGVVYPGIACDLGIYRWPETEDDSVTLRPQAISCRQYPELFPAVFDSIRADLSAVAYNESLARYAEAGGTRGIRVEAAVSGIEGAYGVFGAIALDTRSITLVRDPPPASSTGTAVPEPAPAPPGLFP